MGNVPLAFEKSFAGWNGMQFQCDTADWSSSLHHGGQHYSGQANTHQTIAATPELPVWPQSMRRKANLLGLRLSCRCRR